MYAIIHSIAPFDSAQGTVIHFTWSGNQIYGVRCLIKQNETGEAVFDSTAPSMKQSFTVPVNSGLVNGCCYVAYITVLDVDGNESDLQNIGTPFYCFSTPSFALSIKAEDVIRSSTYNVTLSYSQAELEELDTAQITIYTYQKTELQTSGQLCDAADLTFLATGLENAKDYYIRATGTTLHGILLDTGYLHFTVAYVQNRAFSTLETNNRAHIGAIEVRSNIVSTEGKADNPDILYLEGGGVDLTENRVEFDAGFQAKGDFSGVFRVRNPTVNAEIITVRDETGGLQLHVFYREGSYSDSSGKRGFFELQASFLGMTHVRLSSYVPVLTDREAVLYIVRSGLLFDIYVLEVT